MAASVAMRPSKVPCIGLAAEDEDACGGPMLGWIMPAPLSIPAMRHSTPDEGRVKVRARSLGKVSVVMKAFANPSQAWGVEETEA